MNKTGIGSSNEQRAAAYLRERGHVIAEMNYRCRSGEIDLISRADGYLVFTEVKYRSSTEFGRPSDAVDYKKRKRISSAAYYYVVTHGESLDAPMRFDVIVLSGQGIQHYPDAFAYTGSKNRL